MVWSYLKIKNINQRVEVIALTGHLTEGKLASIKKAGAEEVLLKSFKNEDLIKALGKIF
jgi:CheY-like chemotaxis protein